MIHKSRVMRMKGLIAPSFIRPRLRGWGFSVVEHLVRSLNQYLKANDLSFEVLDEFKIDIFKIKNLTDTLLSPTGQQQVSQRVKMANWQKNYQHAMIMDGEDDYIQKQLSFAGLSDVMKEIRCAIASDMRMPQIKLFGQGPNGLNASGEDEIEVYNSMVESEVRNKSKYDILRVIEIKCQKLFRFIPDDLEIKFKPLRNLNSVEEETVKTAKFTRLLQAKQQGEITTFEFRDACNRDKLLGIQLDNTDDELNPDDPEIEQTVLKTGVSADPDAAIEDGSPDPTKTTGPSIDDPGANREDTRKPRAWDYTSTQKKAPHGPDKNKTAVINSDFKESDHPRADDGKFGSGGGSSKSSKKYPDSIKTYEDKKEYDEEIEERRKKIEEEKEEDEKYEKEVSEKKDIKTKDIKESNKILKEKISLSSNLSDEEKYDIESYSHSGYAKVHGFLQGNKLNDEDKNIAERMIKNLDSALSKSSLKDNLTVYRGMYNVKNIRDMGKEGIGKEINMSSYWSTSPSISTAEEFTHESSSGSGVLFEIKLKKGQKALNGKVNGNKEEPELILPKNQKYKIIDFKPKGNGKPPTYVLEVIEKESVQNKKKWWNL